MPMTFEDYIRDKINGRDAAILNAAFRHVAECWIISGNAKRIMPERRQFADFVLTHCMRGQSADQSELWEQWRGLVRSYIEHVYAEIQQGREISAAPYLERAAYSNAGCDTPPALPPYIPPERE